MPYSKSKRVVKAYESYLAQLLAAKTNISFPSRNPSRLGYKLRESIFASQFFPDTSKYANLQAKFLFRNKGQAVYCELREMGTSEYNGEEVMKDLKSEIVLPEIDSLSGIIGAVLKHKADHFVFPDIADTFKDNENTALMNFCGKYGYSLELTNEGLELIKIDNPTPG